MGVVIWEFHHEGTDISGMFAMHITEDEIPTISQVYIEMIEAIMEFGGGIEAVMSARVMSSVKLDVGRQALAEYRATLN